MNCVHRRLKPPKRVKGQKRVKGRRRPGVYRHRLINVGMITATGKGRVDFAHHATRDWLRNQPAYTAAEFPDD